MAGRTWSLNCSPSLEQAAGQALNLASRGRAPQRPNKIASASLWDRSSSLERVDRMLRHWSAAGLALLVLAILFGAAMLVAD